MEAFLRMLGKKTCGKVKRFPRHGRPNAAKRGAGETGAVD